MPPIFRERCAPLRLSAPQAADQELAHDKHGQTVALCAQMWRVQTCILQNGCTSTRLAADRTSCWDLKTEAGV